MGIRQWFNQLSTSRSAHGLGQWYYCLIHHEPEQGVKCPNISRLGPYATSDDASEAMRRMKERNQVLVKDEQKDDHEGSSE